jgi:pimeloyl-ACP methyl ester carboxylesterase
MIKSHGLLRGFLGGTAAAAPAATSILFCHANGFCKEVWLPVVDELGVLMSRRERRVDWLLADLPGHGDRSTSNLRDATGWIDSMAADVAGHARAHMAGSPRRIGVGMSLGGAALLIAQHKHPALFTDLILLEPVVGRGDPGAPPLATLHAPDSPLASATLKRRSSFASIAEAQAFFASRKVFSKLDARCLQQYCKGGLKKKKKEEEEEEGEAAEEEAEEKAEAAAAAAEEEHEEEHEEQGAADAAEAGGGDVTQVAGETEGTFSLAAEPAFESEIYKRFPIFSPEALSEIGGRGGCRITLAAGADSDFMGGAASYYLGKGGFHESLGGCETVLLDECSHFAPLERCRAVAEIIVGAIAQTESDDGSLAGRRSGEGHPYYDGGTARL